MTLLSAAPTDISRSDAVRFLQRASFGGTPDEVDRLLTIGIDAWIDEQLALQPAQTHHQRRLNEVRFHGSIWQSYLSDPDQLRKRVGYALSQILVASRRDVNDRDVAVYADLLEAHCFDTFRELLEAVTRSVAMGEYLTYNRNRRADDRRGTVPDENYAREVMQLFTIGLWELNQDGTRRTDGSGNPIPTYDTEDILGLARVFTGLRSPDVGDDPARHVLPLMSTGDFADRYHETGEKRFLGTVIPASETRTVDQSLEAALDTLADHPNVGPFIGHQLIQRLITSNPSAQYVQRVANVFADDGSGVRGNLAAVIRAILTDDEAWQTSPPDTFGKLREPVLRFTTAVRALGVSTSHLPWPLDDLSDAATELAQQPFMSNSVFNFYRPGYVPPQSELGDEGLTAPEMQIANETTAIGWINYIARFLMRPPGRTVDRGTPSEYRLQVGFELDELLAMIDSQTVTNAEAGALVDELAARLCPSGLSPAVRAVIVRRVTEIQDERYDPDRTEDYHVRRRDYVHRDRVGAAAAMVVASTDFLWER
ncbi:MAG: DUF1800 family protein [Ilumatobacter sp.]